MKKHFYPVCRIFVLAILISSILSGCSSPNSPSKKRKSQQNPKALPKAYSSSLKGHMKIVPEGNGSNWRFIGITYDNQLAVEINDNSIVSNDHIIYTFEDRKTVYSPDTFVSNTTDTPYKYILGLWNINCTSHEYLLIAITTYDEYNNKLKFYDYHNDNSVKWLKIGYGSISQIEHDYICLDYNRNLGY